MRNARGIDQLAEDVLRQTGCDRIPVPVDRVARMLGLKVEAARFGDNVSGVIVFADDSATIGYNIAQAPVRQRFTIAHEIGHFKLHHQKRTLFIDKHYTEVYRRDQASATGDYLIERQANQFAAALLMPRHLLFQELQKVKFDLGDEIALEELAERFQVSAQAMSIRIANLGFFSSTRGADPSLFD